MYKNVLGIHIPNQLPIAITMEVMFFHTWFSVTSTGSSQLNASASTQLREKSVVCGPGAAAALAFFMPSVIYLNFSSVRTCV